MVLCSFFFTDYPFALSFQIFSCALAQFPPSGNGLEFWQSERPKDMANIVDLEVMCGKQHMEVKVAFDKPFNGIIFSKVRKTRETPSAPSSAFLCDNSDIGEASSHWK